MRSDIATVIFVGATLLSSNSVFAQFTQQGAKLVGSGAVGTTESGDSVAISADGNTAAVGGPDDNSGAGAVWIWTRTNGAWAQQGSKLVGSGAAGNAEQGQSVALSADGNTLIVGGPSDDSQVGAAWVWVRSGGIWTQQGAKLVGSGGVGPFGVRQGISVDLSADGNTAIVGGDSDNSGAGAAWIWTRSGGVWTQQGAKLVGSGATGLFAAQGASVALSDDGNTAVVGGSGDDNGVGAVWVWTRSGGVWTQQGAKLVGSAAVNSSQGSSVSLSADGNTAIVGGPGDNSNVGAVWIWTRSAGLWTQQGSKLIGTGAVAGSNGSNQGDAVSLSDDGNTAIVGAAADDNDFGAAWIWRRSGGTWTQLGGKLVGTGAVSTTGVQQGISVDMSGDGLTVIVGGPDDNSEAGAAWIYVEPGAVNTAPTISAIGPQTTSEDTQTDAIAFTVGDAETAPASLTLSGSSSNAVLVPNAFITFGGSGTNRTVRVTPRVNESGTATITVTVSDGSLSTPTSFLLTVVAVNDAPTITAIGPQTTTQDTPTGAIAFAVDDEETSLGFLTVSGSSSNLALVSNSGIAFSGSGSNRTVTVTPVANQSGSTTITVTVSDGSLSSSTSFLLTVAPSGERHDLLADFGSTFGLWWIPGGWETWFQFHPLSVKDVVSGDLDGNGIDEVVIDFGPVYGIWIWANNVSWSRLHTATANRMVIGDLTGDGRAELVIDFPVFGIWIWFDNAGWVQLHTINSANIVAADLDGNGQLEAIIDFPGYGVWILVNYSYWFNLHTFNTRLMTVGDFDGNGRDDLVMDFAGYGIWNYSNANAWLQVNGLSPLHMTAGDVDGNGKDDFIGDFGGPYGIWMLMNSTTWVPLNALPSENLLTSDLDGNGTSEIIIDFGAVGFWKFVHNAGWIRLHTSSPGAVGVRRAP